MMKLLIRRAEVREIGMIGRGDNWLFLGVGMLLLIICLVWFALERFHHKDRGVILSAGVEVDSPTTEPRGRDDDRRD